MSGYADIARRQRLAAKLGLQTSDHGGYLQGVEDAVEAVAAWFETRRHMSDFPRSLAARAIRRELLEEPSSVAPGAESEEGE
jgi:hypothetical protein